MEIENKNYLGIDWGEKRIGLALADDEMKIATHFGVVNTLDDLFKVIKYEEIGLIILGKPIKMVGGKVVNKKFIDFEKKLRKNFSGEIILFDERLTSKAIKSLAGDKRTKAAKDAISAMIILQDYLDSKVKSQK